MPTDDYETCLANIEDSIEDQGWRKIDPKVGQDLAEAMKIALWGLFQQFLDFVYEEKLHASDVGVDEETVLMNLLSELRSEARRTLECHSSPSKVLEQTTEQARYRVMIDDDFRELHRSIVNLSCQIDHSSKDFEVYSSEAQEELRGWAKTLDQLNEKLEELWGSVCDPEDDEEL